MMRSLTETISQDISRLGKLSQELSNRKRLMIGILGSKKKANDNRLIQNQSQGTSMMSITRMTSTMMRGTETMNIVRNESITRRVNN